MGSPNFTPGVILCTFISLAILVVSVYVSRFYLPRKIKRAYLNSITVLAVAVETRDMGTLGHAQRVAQLTVDLARRFGIRGRGLERMEYAALLMDMGKANVPQAVLNKQGPLTPDEWAIVQTHPRLGAEMVASVPFVADLKEFILHHHEYWNGTGYPDGLKGEEIPLQSRILSIAADYDALVSERPYRPEPHSARDAVEEIRSSLGVKYDPVVGQAFIDMITQESVEADISGKAA